ncbi:hypothetical protein WH47_11912 [Habropoda laboriosa]|uniref:Uncharacterized protein n=1 Tax=Habropoda laboriosa TaxID=597456 RepID=A0A0L7R7Q1_9HYME|nr:hypothetical protein WH47_11912 [Habropoda laboriosa]
MRVKVVNSLTEPGVSRKRNELSGATQTSPASTLTENIGDTFFRRDGRFR